MTMCKIVGAKLSNHVLSTVTTKSAMSCVAKCTADKECKSANYNTASRTCELNHSNGLRHDARAADFDVNTGDLTNLYFHSHEC